MMTTQFDDVPLQAIGCYGDSLSHVGSDQQPQASGAMRRVMLQRTFNINLILPAHRLPAIRGQVFATFDHRGALKRLLGAAFLLFFLYRNRENRRYDALTCCA